MFIYILRGFLKYFSTFELLTKKKSKITKHGKR